MAKIEHFTAEEIPYEILAKFGLTHEMIDDLPQNVMLRLLSSRKWMARVDASYSSTKCC